MATATVDESAGGDRYSKDIPSKILGPVPIKDLPAMIRISGYRLVHMGVAVLWLGSFSVPVLIAYIPQLWGGGRPSRSACGSCSRSASGRR